MEDNSYCDVESDRFISRLIKTEVLTFMTLMSIVEEKEESMKMYIIEFNRVLYYVFLFQIMVIYYSQCFHWVPKRVQQI